MDCFATFADSTGFARAGNDVWLFAPGRAFRAEDKGLITVPWTEETDRPHRFSAPDGLWKLVRIKKPLLCGGPRLQPETEEEFFGRKTVAFYSDSTNYAWAHTDLTRERPTLHRSDGIPISLPKKTVSARTFLDLAPLGERTAVLSLEGLLLLGAESAERVPIDLSEDARILFLRGEEVWIRDGRTVWHVRRGIASQLPEDLQVAGDLLAIREGPSLRLPGHPMGRDNALRSARHAWADGPRLWVAGDDSISILEKGRPTRVFPNNAPRFANAILFAQEGKICAASRPEEGREGFAIDRFEKNWKPFFLSTWMAAGGGRAGGDTWVVTDRGPAVVRQDGSHQLHENFPAGHQLAAGGGRAAVNWLGQMYLLPSTDPKRSKTPVWRKIPWCQGLDGSMISQFDTVARWIVALVQASIEAQPRVFAWDHGWRRISFPDRGTVTVVIQDALWLSCRTSLSRWTGGPVLERWHLPDASFGEASPDTGNARFFWWKGFGGYHRGDMKTGEVVKAPDDMHRLPALTAPDGAVWVSLESGVARLEPGELVKIAGRVERLEDEKVEIEDVPDAAM